MPRAAAVQSTKTEDEAALRACLLLSTSGFALVAAMLRNISFDDDEGRPVYTETSLYQACPAGSFASSSFGRLNMEPKWSQRMAKQVRAQNIT